MRTRLLTGMLSLLAATISLTATTVRIVNLSEMVQASDRVFHGRCVSAREMTHSNGLPIVEYTFLVTDGIKGTVEGERVVFRQLQASRARGFGIAGLPVFRKGQDLVLFLAADSRIGLTSPTGLSQGVFSVLQDRRGKLAIVNSFKNQNLAHDLEPSRLYKMGLKHSQAELLRSQGPISLEALSEAVRSIDTYQRLKAPGSVQ